MSDWFNDPFFDDKGDPFGHSHGGFGGDIFSEMDKMHKHMSRMFQSAFNDTFPDSFFDDDMPRGSIGYERNPRKPHVEEIPNDIESSKQEQKSRKQPVIQEPSDSDDDANPSFRGNSYSNEHHHHSNHHENPKPQCYCYSSSSSSYYDSATGVKNFKRIDQDSTGKKHLAEMRQVGDKKVIYDRKVGPDGKPIDSVKPIGMNDQEIDDFNREFKQKSQARRGLGYSSPSHKHNSTRALK